MSIIAPNKEHITNVDNARGQERINKYIKAPDPCKHKRVFPKQLKIETILEE